jgi:glyoxylase-like metal-dependent hydrolase (beta-lactamase superfamily II)
MSLARQIGLVPPAGSALESRLFAAFNARTKAARRVAARSDLERVADGVWLLRGGVPRTMNVYFLEDEGGGVTLFDAGIRTMTHAISTAAAPLGGINRVVLGHADADHRGAAPGLGAPVYCHPADREAAETDDALRTYFHFERLGIPARYVYRGLLRMWDGGAVEIAGTLDEGDTVNDFRVVHLPGHAPGLIALFRERDRLALTSDCFYVIDPETSRKVPPGPPHPAFNDDTEQARASIRKLAALDPAAAWPGHADPLTGDVRAQLERAAGA